MKKRVMVIVLLLATILSMFPMVGVRPETAEAAGTIYIEGLGHLMVLHQGGDGYKISLKENKDMIISCDYFSNSDALVSYHTERLFFTKERTGGNPTSVQYYEHNVHDHEIRYGQNRSYDTYTVPREVLVEMLLELFGEEGLKTKQKVRMSEGYIIKERDTADSEWEYLYDEEYSSLTGIQKARDWSNTTKMNFAKYFDIEIELELIPYNITVTAAAGGSVGQDCTEAYAGDDVTINAYPDDGYSFAGWTVVSGNISSFNKSSAETTFTMPSCDVELRANFKEKYVPITEPPLPDTYTLTIEAGEGGTASVVSGKKKYYYGDEEVTVKATPNQGCAFMEWAVSVESGETLDGFDISAATNSFVMPESNVTLTALFVTPPDEDVDYEERFIRYYTTDKGYSMSRIYNGDTALKPDNDYAFGYIADGSSSVGWREIGETTPTKLTEYYETGTDAAGNEWYFIPDGNNATYVHPKVYNNYNVATDEIKNITELVFPETIEDIYKKSYDVTSIGGGLGKYREESDDDTRNQPSYGFNITDGRYQYNEKYTSDIGTETYTENIRIYFGVLGNGSVTSKGSYQLRYTNGVREYYDYQNDYHVYNTTLTSVTIPDTVITIENYAFYNCQALETVTGGAGVKNIRAYAFEGAGHLTPSLSTLRVDEYENPVKQRYYYYNKAYAFGGFTATMSEWQRSVRLSSHLSLPGEGTTTPAFPVLQYIEEYAFRRRNNFGSVSLPSGVISIGEGAFAACALNSITIPGMDTVIKEGSVSEGHTTLGTKGAGVEKKTVIITEPDSKAMDYGIAYNPYYDVRAGYTVTYHNNSTPPDTYSTKADVSLIKENIVKKAEVYSSVNSGGYVTDSARNTIYMDEEGRLWLRESTAKTLPELLFDGLTFCTLELIQGTSSSYSSSGSSPDSITSVHAIAFAENGTVYGIAPDGTCTDFGIPAGSTGHLWGNMTLSSNKSEASPYGSGGSTATSVTNYLYYLYNGAVYRKKVYGETASSYSSSSGGGGANSFSTYYGTVARKISPNGAVVTSFYVFSTSLNEKGESIYNGPQSSSNNKSYTYSLPKAFLMTSGGNCMAGGNNVEEHYNTSSGSSADKSAGYSETVFTNGPEELSYTWTTMAASNCFRQIFAGSENNINVIDGEGNLIYIRNSNQSSSGYLGCGTAVTVCAGKNFVSAEVMEGFILLTDASGNTWKYVESTGVVTACDYSAPEAIPVESLVVGYEFVTALYDCMFETAGREFIGWSLRADGTGVTYQPGQELRITAPTTLYAQWGGDGKAKKIIRYLPNGGVGMMEDDEYSADTPNPVTLSRNNPPKDGYTRNGYAFAGWSYKAEPGPSDKIYKDGAEIVIPIGITTLYAQWDSTITYTVIVGSEDMRVTEQDFDEFHLGLDETLILEAKEDKIYNVSYHLNDREVQPSMSVKAAFVTELTERNTKATLQFYGWRLYEDMNRDRKIDDTDRYVGYYRAGDILKNLATEKDAVFYAFPDWGGSASYVQLPEIACDGYVFVGYTPGNAYKPDWFDTPETYNEAIREGVLVMAPIGSKAKYQPKSDGEVLYAYYERKERAGQIYGFEVYDVFGSPPWKEVIGTDTRYTIGVQEGSDVWNTLPLRSGVHPLYRNLGGLPMGGGFSFHVVSTGDFAKENVILRILPYLCPVGAEGYDFGDLYYEQETEGGNLLKKWKPEEQAIILYADKDSEVALAGESRIWTGTFRLPEMLWLAKEGTNVAEYQRKYGLNFEEEFWQKEVRLMLRFALSLENEEGECLYYGMLPAESGENTWLQEVGEPYREDYDKNYYKLYGGEVAVIYLGDSADNWNRIYGIY